MAIGGEFTWVIFDEPPVVACVIVTPTVMVMVSPFGPIAVVVVLCSPGICLSTKPTSSRFREILCACLSTELERATTLVRHALSTGKSM